MVSETKKYINKTHEAKIVFKDSEDEDAVAFLVDGKNENETITWCLNSGASDHLINNDAYFTKFEKLYSPIIVGVA